MLASTGTVIERIAERRQPVILLIEQANGWRCFRFEDEVSPLVPSAVGDGGLTDGQGQAETDSLLVKPSSPVLTVALQRFLDDRQGRFR